MYILPQEITFLLNRMFYKIDMKDIRTNNTIEVTMENEKQIASDLVRYSYEGKLINVKEMVDIISDVNTLNENGELALHSAIRAGNDEVAAYLLAVNANPNIVDLTGNDALYYAAMKNNVPLAVKLIQEGAYVNGAKDSIVPPLIAAALYNNREMVDFLIKEGAEVDATDKKGKTALYYATAQKHTQTQQSLLNAGARPVKVSNKMSKRRPAWKKMLGLKF